jgi:hypothetical protein
MVPPTNLDDLSPTELKNLVVSLFEKMAELQRTIAAQADEIARLKGGPRRPNLKPSGMDKATEPKPDKPAGDGKGKRGNTKTKLTIHEEKTVKVDAPPGSRFRPRVCWHHSVGVKPVACANTLPKWLALQKPHIAAIFSKGIVVLRNRSWTRSIRLSRND